jgi:hypothetical protein
VLQQEHEFYLIKNQSSYELPSDFGFFLNKTMWDRVESRPMGLVSPQVWQEFKSGLIQSSVYKRWRVKANDGTKEIFIDPTPTATQCVYECRDGSKVKVGAAFEYISKYTVNDTSGVPKELFTVDTDTFRIDDNLLELEFKWRWLNALGQTYHEEKAEAERYHGILKAQDGGAPTVTADNGSSYRYPNIPETGIGLS